MIVENKIWQNTAEGNKGCVVEKLFIISCRCEIGIRNIWCENLKLFAIIFSFALLLSIQWLLVSIWCYHQLQNWTTSGNQFATHLNTLLQLLCPQPRQFAPSFSGLAFSTPAIWFNFVVSYIVHPCDLVRHCEVLQCQALGYMWSGPFLSGLALVNSHIWVAEAIQLQLCVFISVVWIGLSSIMLTTGVIEILNLAQMHCDVSPFVAVR